MPLHTPHSLPHVVWSQPRARSGVATYLNLLVACTAIASAAVSGALVLLGEKKDDEGPQKPTQTKDERRAEP